MPLAPLWKTAKTTFENTTKAKKPTEKWIGNIRKSTGIESALQDVDKAKTASDLAKALTKLGTASTAYINLLDTTAKDPKAVPSGDKSVYVTAINKLKADLQHLKEEGEKLETALEGAEKKDKVSPELLKAANDHIALRLKGAEEAQKLAGKMRALHGQVTQAAAGAVKQVEEAKKAASQSNTMLHQVAVGVIEKYIDQADKIAEEAVKVYKEITEGSGVMMQARSDNKSVFDALPPSIMPALKKKRDDAWRPVTQATSVMSTLLNEIKAKAMECKAARAQAESVGNQMRDPAEYVKEFNKLAEEIAKLGTDTMVKGNRLIQYNEEMPGLMNKPPQEQADRYRNVMGVWQRYEQEIKAAVQTQKQLLARAVAPRGAMEEPAVVKAIESVKKVAKEWIDKCEASLLAGSQMASKVQLQSQRLEKTAKAGR